MLERRAVSVKVDCGAEDCSLTGRGTVKPTGASTASPLARWIWPPDEKAVLRFPLGTRLRRAASRALDGGAPVRVRIAVTAVDADANAVTKRWTARLRG